MTDSDIWMAAPYKLRTPSLIHQRMLDGKLHSIIKYLVFRLFLMPFEGSALCIEGQILTCQAATSRCISFQLPADCGWVNTDFFGNGFLAHSCFQKSFDSVPLVRTEVVVVIGHRQSKDCTTRGNGKKAPKGFFTVISLVALIT